jgi:hypothetical protein
MDIHSHDESIWIHSDPTRSAFCGCWLVSWKSVYYKPGSWFYFFYLSPITNIASGSAEHSNHAMTSFGTSSNLLELFHHIPGAVVKFIQPISSPCHTIEHSEVLVSPLISFCVIERRLGAWQHLGRLRRDLRLGRISADICVFEDKMRSVVSFKRNAEWNEFPAISVASSWSLSLRWSCSGLLFNCWVSLEWSIAKFYCAGVAHSPSRFCCDRWCGVCRRFVFRLDIVILITSASGKLHTLQKETASISYACLGLYVRLFVQFDWMPLGRDWSHHPAHEP